MYYMILVGGQPKAAITSVFAHATSSRKNSISSDAKGAPSAGKQVDMSAVTSAFANAYAVVYYFVDLFSFSFFKVF